MRPAGRASRWYGIVVIAAVLATWSTPADAQRSLSIKGRKDLTFGTVLRGVPVTVVPTSSQGGAWSVRGEPAAEIQVALTLPTRLISAAGQTMPVEFGAIDAAFSKHPQGRNAQTFDPRLPLVTTLASKNGRLYVFLGGTALPSAAQSSGTYVAPITITVSYTGI